MFEVECESGRELWKIEGLEKWYREPTGADHRRFSVVKRPSGKALKPIGSLGFTLPPKA